MTERFVMTGIGGVWNYGCEAIVRSTDAILRDVFPDCEVELVSVVPKADAAALADTRIRIRPARPRWSLHRIFRKVLRTAHLPWNWILDVNPTVWKQATCVLSIGGDIYTPHAGGLPWGTLLQEEHVLSLRTPLCLWGATVGPFEAGSPQEVRIKRYLDRLLLVSVRESKSVDYLRSIGVTRNVFLAADPAFTLRPDPFDCGPYWPRAKADAVVALNLSPLLDFYLEAVSPDRTVRKIGKACVERLLEALPISLVLMPHVIARNEADDDYRLLAAIAASLDRRFRDRVSVLPPGLGATRTKYLLGRCRAAVCARMHCAIAAVSSLVPTVCISYSMKSLECWATCTAAPSGSSGSRTLRPRSSLTGCAPFWRKAQRCAGPWKRTFRPCRRKPPRQVKN